MRSVTLLDTFTNERKVALSRDEGFDYYWQDGNGSCDCNRELRFLPDKPLNASYCSGCLRYLIIEVDYHKIDLKLWNECYPEDLIEKWNDILETETGGREITDDTRRK